MMNGDGAVAARESLQAMDMRAYLAVGALVVRNEDEVLVGQAGQGAPVELPGGPVVLGEALVPALERALEEIVGLACTIGPYLGAVEDRDASGRYTLQHIFRVDLEQGGVAVARTLPDGRRLGWCKADGLPAANLQPVSLQRLVLLYLNWDRSAWWATNSIR